MIVSRLLSLMAGGAYGLGGRGIVRQCLNVFVAIGATENAMDGGFELGIIHVQADLFAVLVFGESGIIMASQAVVIAHLGGIFGYRSRSEEQRDEENQTATLHRNPRFQRTRRLRLVTYQHRR